MKEIEVIENKDEEVELRPSNQDLGYNPYQEWWEVGNWLMSKSKLRYIVIKDNSRLLDKKVNRLVDLPNIYKIVIEYDRVERLVKVDISSNDVEINVYKLSKSLIKLVSNGHYEVEIRFAFKRQLFYRNHLRIRLDKKGKVLEYTKNT